MRTSRAIRTAAWGLVAAGIAAPLVRRRLNLRPRTVAAIAAGAPFGMCVVRPRTPGRDVATCCLQMWAYVAAYQMPHDDPDALARRVHIDYPVKVDRILGLGRLPTMRLQRLLATPDRISRYDKVLIWVHWLWFMAPHTALIYTLAFHRERVTRAAVMTYACFDLGLVGYWAVPTAPPWYGAQHGRVPAEDMPELRRMMYEYGEEFWKERWGPLYAFLGGNPLAAMPSLHFATSVMAAHLLAEIGPAQGAVGWTYALTLGLALVYLGEHYLIDLLAGLALTEGIRRAAPAVTPMLAPVSRAVQFLEARAQDSR